MRNNYTKLQQIMGHQCQINTEEYSNLIYCCLLNLFIYEIKLVFENMIFFHNFLCLFCKTDTKKNYSFRHYFTIVSCPNSKTSKKIRTFKYDSSWVLDDIQNYNSKKKDTESKGCQRRAPSFRPNIWPRCPKLI